MPLASRHISEAPGQQSALLPSRQAASPLSGSGGVAGGSGAGSTKTDLTPLDPNYEYIDQSGRDVMKKRKSFDFLSRRQQNRTQQAAIDKTPHGRRPPPWALEQLQDKKVKVLDLAEKPASGSNLEEAMQSRADLTSKRARRDR